MEYIVLNLERNQDRGGSAEIAQIGAVLVNEKLDVLDTFRMKLEAGDRESFTDTMEKFRLWCGDCPLVTWGQDDIWLLEDCISENGLNLDWMPEVYDAREIFEEQVSGHRQADLNYAMMVLGMKPRTVKNALTRSLHMVKVLQNLSFARGIASQRWESAGSYCGGGYAGYEELCDYGYELA